MAGLSRSTVEKIFATLRAIGAIDIVGQRPSRGGRPHHLYGLVPTFRYFVAADFSIPDLTVGLMDLQNHLHCRRDSFLDSSRPMPVREAVRRLADEVEACLLTSGVVRSHVLNLNVSLPGPILSGRSTIQNRALSDWSDVAVAAELEERTGLRTIVMNDVANMMATELSVRGELGATPAMHHQNTLFLALRRGGIDQLRVGAAYALPASDKLQVFPGSVAHFATGRDTSECRCGNRGCLEQALQDLGPVRVDSGDAFWPQVSDILNPVLNSLVRFTEAQRVILDLTGAGAFAAGLQDSVEERLRATLAPGPFHDTVVESAVSPSDASLRGAALNGLQTLLTTAAPASVFFDADQDATWREEAVRPSAPDPPARGQAQAT
jgi:predicted NBD/HSP70 family sugar kinase